MPHKMSKESASTIAGLQSRVDELIGKSGAMELSITLSLLVIGLEEHKAVIKLNELQAFELQDFGTGGMFELYLKGRLEPLIIPVHDEDKWSMLKEFINKSLINISNAMNIQDIDESWKYKTDF